MSCHVPTSFPLLAPVYECIRSKGTPTAAPGSGYRRPVISIRNCFFAACYSPINDYNDFTTAQIHWDFCESNRNHQACAQEKGTACFLVCLFWLLSDVVFTAVSHNRFLHAFWWSRDTSQYSRNVKCIQMCFPISTRKVTNIFNVPFSKEFWEVTTSSWPLRL